MKFTWIGLLAQGGGETLELTAAGAVVMAVSVGLVLALATFCMARILSERRPDEQHHAPLDIDTRDADR